MKTYCVSEPPLSEFIVEREREREREREKENESECRKKMQHSGKEKVCVHKRMQKKRKIVNKSKCQRQNIFVY